MLGGLEWVHARNRVLDASAHWRYLANTMDRWICAVVSCAYYTAFVVVIKAHCEAPTSTHHGDKDWHP